MTKSNAEGVNEFQIDLDALSLLTAAVARELRIQGEVALSDFSGEWYDEQLADLIDRAQAHDHRAIVPPSIRGKEVAVVAYAVEDGLIFAIRDEPLFFKRGAQIDAGWDEPDAFIPVRPDGSDLDLENLEAILRLVVERANALFPVLVAATRVPSPATTKEQP